ncbi:MAG: SUF system Fe-S cluster assembly protein [Rhodospirillaceae bacterium]
MMPPYSMPAMDTEPPEEGEVVVRGSRLLSSDDEKASESAVVEALRSVFDPEIPVNIYDLGLIYDVTMQDNGDVGIMMTLTAPACPVAGTLPGEVAEAVAAIDGTGEVSVTITWDPPWTPENMSEVARVALDMF